MRTNSVSVAIVIVLLSVSCMLCSAGWYDRISAYTPYSGYRADLADLEDVADVENVENASDVSDVEETVEYEENDVFIEQVVEALAGKIVETSDCGARNIDELMMAVEQLNHPEPGTDMDNKLQEAGKVCLEQFERQWLDNKLEEKFGPYSKRLSDQFDEFNAAAPGYKKGVARTDTLSLLSAARGFFDRLTSSKTKLITATKVDELQKDEMYSDAAKLVKLTPRDTKVSTRTYPEGISLEAALKYQEDLFSFCQEFIGQEWSKSILEPVGKLANCVDLVRLKMEPLEGETISTFLWASRYYSCKFMLTQDKQALAEAAVKEAKKAYDKLNPAEAAAKGKKN